MKSNSQKLKVINQLKEFGSVSRNWALSNFISRLGAIICDLTKDGYKFDTKYQTINGGKDYVYTVIEKPEEELKRGIKMFEEQKGKDADMKGVGLFSYPPVNPSTKRWTEI